MSTQRVIIGNSLDVLKDMEPDSIDVCVTSPPYWGLRDYGSDPVVWGGDEQCDHEWQEGDDVASAFCSKCGAWRGQLGLEPNPFDYIEHLCAIFDEVKRVLKPTGACWVNIGDTYSSNTGAYTSNYITSSKHVNSKHKLPKVKEIREKSLIQIPSRFAIAMCDRGWILRNEVIWHKPNPMPVSIKDRFTVDFEKFYFFTKNPDYYFKQQFEPMVGKYTANKSTRLDTSRIVKEENTSKWASDDMEAKVRQGMSNRGNGIIAKRYSLPAQEDFVEYMRAHADRHSIIEGTDIIPTTAEHWFRRDTAGFTFPSVEDWMKIRDKVSEDSDVFRSIDSGLTDVTYETDDVMKNSDGINRNKRTTWTIPISSSHEEHCAMFPSRLIEVPIRACCPDDGVVLDPFCGSGTTLEYCRMHDLNGIGIEINPDFKDIIDRRSMANVGKLEDFA